jgi:hypothetical protein
MKVNCRDSYLQTLHNQALNSHQHQPNLLTAKTTILKYQLYYAPIDTLNMNNK